MEDEWESIDEVAEAEPDEKTLVLVYYVGHAVSTNMLTSAIGEMGQSNDHDFEGFLRDCARQSNIYCIGMFDCCRSDRGRGGIFTNLDDCHNIVSIYREPITEYKSGYCRCEPWREDNFMAKRFFSHLQEA